MHIIVPAGLYYLGDPCYGFGHDEKYNNDWMGILTNADFFKNQISVTYGDLTIWASGTAFGDGVYQVEDTDMEIGVDAGMIGLVPANYVERADNVNTAYAMHKIEFQYPVTMYGLNMDNKGLIQIGPYKIFTNKNDW